MSRLILVALLLTFVLPLPTSSANVRVTSITDGDTIKLGDGKSVRLLQIDTPELKGNECYAKEARVALAKLDRKSTRLNSSHVSESRMPSSA